MKLHRFLATTIIVYGCAAQTNDGRNRPSPQPSEKAEGSNSGGGKTDQQADSAPGAGNTVPETPPTNSGAGVQTPSSPVKCLPTSVSAALQCFEAAINILIRSDVANAEDRTSLASLRDDLKSKIAASSTNDTYRLLACTKNSLIRFRISNMSFRARRDGLLKSPAEFETTFDPSISGSDAIKSVLKCP